jgi:hypothetical protein
VCPYNAGESNGLQKVWINGRLVLNEKNLKYRVNTDSDAELIGGLHWQVYHGGSKEDPLWAPGKDQSIECVFPLNNA